MPDRESPVALASEFPAADLAAWEALAGDLDRLRSTTLDGVTIEPLYNAADAIGDPGLPGFAPFVRGRTAAGNRASGWDVRQIVRPQDGPGLAIGELERGATSLLVQLRRVEHIDADLLAEALDAVLLELAPIVLDAGSRWADAAASLVALWEREGIASDDARGCLGADPLGEWASERSTVDVDAQVRDAASWAWRVASTYPQVRTFAIDATRFHFAGASDAQELGLGIATAVDTLRATIDAGLDVADAFGQVEFRYAATADQFATISKFRAARRIWARVADIAGVPEAAALAPLHAVTSIAMMTSYDPWVNMLRGAVGCFAAGVGGADAITVRAYDECSAPRNSELGRRIARNTQTILAMESHLTDVVDPAGGSWYVERLTADVAQAAWDVFQEVEQAGGFRAAMAAGIVNERIAAVREQRRSDVHHRRAPITGVTEFPNVNEPPPGVWPLHAPSDGSLVRHRWVEQVENLRSRVDAAAAGTRPSVFLATIGTPATFTNRAMFAKNFFEVAGIEARTGPVTSDPDEIAAAFAADAATVACICSSDDTYATTGAAVAEALVDAGARRVYLAGRPANSTPDVIDSLTDAGVTHTIHAGADVFMSLSDLAEFLEVPA